MNFLALIIAVALQQLAGPHAPWHRDGWFDRWWRWLEARGASPALTAAVAVLLPTLAALWLLAAVGGGLFGLVGLGLAVLLLLYGLGRGDFNGLMADLRAHCAAGDGEAAWLTAEATLSHLEATGDGEGRAPGEELRAALLYEACQRWYAPVFFFVLAGPAGALGYRLLQLSAARGVPARRALRFADWAPARLLALTFAVTGDFAAAARALARGDEAAPELLGETARCAVGTAAAAPGATAAQLARELAALEQLLTRSAGAWLIVLSLGYLLL
ncbi:MAG TPA: regulatory signaling modulator protein AmpE [Pseudohaliea sp.]|nr:regulatory signaling modulator protein AmpE [Pseudohaliea sp.]